MGLDDDKVVMALLAKPELAQAVLFQLADKMGFVLADKTGPLSMNLGPWMQINDKGLSDTYIRQHIQGTQRDTVVYVSQVRQDHPVPSRRGAWHVTSSTQTPSELLEAMDALPYVGTLEGAQRRADDLLRGHGYVLDFQRHQTGRFNHARGK